MDERNNERVTDYDKELEKIQEENEGINSELSSYEFDEQGNSKELPLQHGYEDKDSAMHMTFRFREMTGKDEEAVNKPDVKSNGGKMINMLLARCVTFIGTLSKKDFTPKEWENIICNLATGDQDIIMKHMRKSTLGEEMEVKHNCTNPKCKAALTTYIQIDEIEVIPFKGEYTVPFELKRGYKTKQGKLLSTGIMRMPNGHDREVLTPVALKNEAKATTLMLTRISKFDGYDLPITEDIMSSLTTGDRILMSDILKENAFGLKFELETDCSTCGETVKIALKQVNFI